MIQRRVEEVFPGQRQRAGARTCSCCRAENGRTENGRAENGRTENGRAENGRTENGRGATAGRPSHLAGGVGFRWLTLAAEMAGLVYGGRAPSPDAAGRPVRMPLIATRMMSADMGSIRAARDFTTATLRRWGMAERCQDVTIVVSELLTNALRHALPEPADARPRWPIRLGLLQQGPGVLCAVADPGKAVPMPQAPDWLAETGRGLQMVCALSDRWGYTTPSDTGKVVWAVFGPR